MNIFQAFILGVVQGLTEFIPVSSTAHLLIAEKLLGLPSSDQLFSFSVIIQLGTVLAMLAFFWNDIFGIVKAFFLGIYYKRPFDDLQARLGWLVILASIPALVAGFLLKDVIPSMFQDAYTQGGIRLLVTAVMLTAVEYFDNRTRSLDSATWQDALSVGLFQVLAIFPGASRSGSTIAGGMVRGFDRPAAARFAFLMSGPVLVAAGAYQSLKVIQSPDMAEHLPFLVVGFITAGIVGWLSIRWLIGYLSRHSLYIFAAYCAVAGVVVLFLK